MKRVHHTFVILLICGLTAGSLFISGCNFLPEEEAVLAPPLMEPATIEYRNTPVERGDLLLQSRMSGVFAPEVQQALSFERQGGRLKDIHVRLGEAVEEGQLLMELESDPLESQIRLQEIEVEKANLNIEQLQAGGADRYARRRAELDLEQQEIRLEDLNIQLEASRIFAPFDGEITYLPSVSIGDYVNAYQIMARVADISKMILVTTSDQASNLPIGVNVDVEYENQQLVGEVVANPSTLFNDPDERLHQAAIISIDDDILPEDVSLGSSVRITYIEEERLNVLVLPRNRINLMSGRRYVNVLEDGVRVEKDVEVGLMTDTEAEIINGLEEGDLVIIN